MKILKQRYYHSCLVSSLMMIAGLEDEKAEQKIFFDGEKKIMPYYLNSILNSFQKFTNLKLIIFVDNKYFTEELTESLNNNMISVMHKKITTDLIVDLVQNHPIVVHIDDHYIGDYSHCSHFVVISKIRKDGKLEILDPWFGNKKFLSKERLHDSILSLKNYIKMCPVVIMLER